MKLLVLGVIWGAPELNMQIFYGYEAGIVVLYHVGFRFYNSALAVAVEHQNNIPLFPQF